MWSDRFHGQVSTIAITGIALSNFCHLLSVLVIYNLSGTTSFQTSESISSVAIVIAVLHIINPAGAFLLSPYSEALFSLLNMLGFQLYLNGLRNHYQNKNLLAEIHCLAAGAVFAFATTVRSNGLLSGTLFLYDAIVTALSIYNGDRSIGRFRRMFVIIIGGCLIALGAIIPQYRVYQSYCTFDTGSETRPWCNNYLPSIYAWVQSHYWYEVHTRS